MEEILFTARQVCSHKKKKGFMLQDINFELPAGYIMGIIGKNGAGKTTFFDCIMREKKQYSGTFLLEGQDIHEDHLQALDQIGFISEENKFFDMRTAGQNAQMLGRFYTDFSMERFREAMDACNLSDKKNVGKMSRGEQMKFQLSFAVAHRPKLFLLDEATAGMDPVFRIDFYKQLRKLLADESCSVIMSTHNEEEIDRQLDYIGLLEQGRFRSFQENELR